jgi:hypothetical protein
MELGEISRKRGQALTAYREYKDDIIAQMNILQQAMSGE